MVLRLKLELGQGSEIVGLVKVRVYKSPHKDNNVRSVHVCVCVSPHRNARFLQTRNETPWIFRLSSRRKVVIPISAFLFD